MSASKSTQELVNAVAVELAAGVDTAVESWMAQFERVFSDARLTSLGKLNALREILERYKNLTGKTQLQCRRA